MQTEPLVSFYEGGGAPLLRVDGSGELETVQTEIAAAVSGLSKGSQ
jgi:hypothetical protein